MIQRVLSIMNRIAKKKITPRQQFKKVLQESFGHLSPAIVDSFFANFGYAMPLSLLVKIETISKEMKPNLVIEFGSGSSTVIISDSLSASDSLLVSIDESMKWLENTSKLVNHKDRVAFVCIPDSSGINHTALSKYFSFKGKTDLLVIDGPSQGNRFSEHALRVYNDLLTSNCVCVVDDTDREENDLGARKLAAEFSLRKCDYGDPIYVNHQYSILFPEHFDDEVLFNVKNET
jgi:cephalosporin hydroxylase